MSTQHTPAPWSVEICRVMTIRDLIIRHERMPLLADAWAYIADADDYAAIRANLGETPEVRLYRVRMESCLADSWRAQP